MHLIVTPPHYDAARRTALALTPLCVPCCLCVLSLFLFLVFVWIVTGCAPPFPAAPSLPIPAAIVPCPPLNSGETVACRVGGVLGTCLRFAHLRNWCACPGPKLHKDVHAVRQRVCEHIHVLLYNHADGSGPSLAPSLEPSPSTPLLPSPAPREKRGWGKREAERRQRTLAREDRRPRTAFEWTWQSLWSHATTRRTPRTAIAQTPPFGESGNNTVPIGIASSLTCLIYMGGHLSGAHLNPVRLRAAHTAASRQSCSRSPTSDWATTWAINVPLCCHPRLPACFDAGRHSRCHSQRSTWC